MRSRKVVGETRSLMVHGEKHEKSLKVENIGKSLFYSSYPHSTNENSSDLVWKGYFENLQQYCVVGFLRLAVNMEKIKLVMDDQKNYLVSVNAIAS